MDATEKKQYSKRHFLCCIIIVFVVIAFRQREVLFTPYLMAEDASTFLQRALNDGILSIFKPNAGYIHFIPQTVTCMAVFLSRLFGQGIQLVPYIMMFCALCFSAFSLSYFCRDKFAWLIEKRIYRLICVVFIAILCGTKAFEIWHTITSAQWWGGIFIFFVGLNMLHEKDLPKSRLEMAVLIIIGLSTPLGGISVLLFWGILLYNFFKEKTITKWNLIKTILITLPTILQGILTLQNGRTNTDTGLIKNIFCSFKTLIGTVPAVLYPHFLEQNYVIGTMENQYVVLLIGCIIWIALLAWHIINRRWVIGYILIFSEVCLLLAYISNGSYIHELMFWYSNAHRYLFLPQVAFVLALGIAVYDMFMKKIYILPSLLIAISFGIGCNGYIIFQQNEYTMMYEQNAFLYDKEGKGICYIPVNPKVIKWARVLIPINLDSMNEIVCQDPIYSINTINGQQDISSLSKDEVSNMDYLIINGWLVDPVQYSDPATILLKVGKYYYAAGRTSSPVVDEYFGGDGNFTKSNFEFIIPSKVVVDNNFEYQMVVITEDKNNYYVIEDKLDICE